MAQVINAALQNIDIQLDIAQPTISIDGHLDSSNITDLKVALDRLMREHDCCISLDLSTVESIDTTALESLAVVANAFSKEQKHLRLCGASCVVQNMLDRLMLSDLFCTEHECLSGRCNTPSVTCDIFTLSSDLGNCREARERVDSIAKEVGLSDCSRDDLMLAMGEAVSNAIRHGHSGKSDSCFTVSCVGTPGKLEISVSDNGPGFSMSDVPSFEESLFLEHGRGIYCMNAVMDEVTYMFGTGTTLRMIKSDR